jgi:hypothetical protein
MVNGLLQQPWKAVGRPVGTEPRRHTQAPSTSTWRDGPGPLLVSEGVHRSGATT